MAADAIQWYKIVLEIGSVLPRNEAITAALETLRAAGFGAEVDGDEFDLLCVGCGQPITEADDLIDDGQGGYRHRQCPAGPTGKEQ
jgi:hypothetical protein